jgi:D-glycero-beta-D-manno-heptose 1-phosphate adenylyltransferase
LSPSESKIVSDGQQLDKRLATLSRPFVFTNGVFDILHRGHVSYLEQAAELGTSLIVGVNSDASARRLDKGEDRPINALEDRMALLAALACVTLVVPFDEDTPLALIKRISPDYLVKGGDWVSEHIVGADFVRSRGGEVHAIPIRYRRSTSDLIKRIRAHG